MNVAVLGLGGLGRSLAERARDTGHDVIVWNRTPGKADGLPEAPGPVAAAEHADAVLVAVHDETAVRDVCTAAFLDVLVHGTYLLLVTTVSPGLARGLAAESPGRVLDTPVLGSPDMVRAGEAQFLLGGDADAVAAVSPLLTDLAPNPTCCGPVGTASTMKIVSNLQLVIGVSALAEAVALARRQGVDDAIARKVFGSSPVVSESVRLGLAAMLDPGHRGVLGPAADAVKDLDLATGLAPDLDLAVTPAAKTLLARIGDRDWPDFSAVIEGLR